jgi:hypothetical protein
VTISGRDTTIRRDPDATQDFRIFHVLPGGTLTLNSLKVSGGDVAGAGGGIANNSGTLNLNRTVIKRNHADTGGGLSNFAGDLNLHHSTVVRNTADNFGGGILNDGRGTTTMKGGSLLKNRAVTSNGGGLENILGTASLDSVSVRGNTALVGGGIRNTNGSTVRLTSTTLRENIAVSGAGLSNNSSTATSTATLNRSLVTRNTAITSGGGILNEPGGQVTLTASRVIRNNPDNCAPEGSVPGCTNPTNSKAPSTSKLPLPPAKDKKARK